MNEWSHEYLNVKIGIELMKSYSFVLCVDRK